MKTYSIDPAVIASGMTSQVMPAGITADPTLDCAVPITNPGTGIDAEANEPSPSQFQSVTPPAPLPGSGV
jgi:hypothetical protein